MKRKAVYMFISPFFKEPQRMVMDLGTGEEIMVGVGSYEMACDEAKKLKEEDVVVIELCGGFGTRGHYMVAEAAGSDIKVGVVRYDNHPGYDGQSGDERWK